MTEEANTSRSWKSVARSDADVDLLQRSIKHVEHLLSRLEYGGVPTALGADDGDGDSDGDAIAAGAAETEPTARTQSGEPTTAAGPLPPAVQADALRITLEAHEEAYRIRAQATAVHAEAVAESERLLIEVQQMCELLRANANQEAGAGNLQAVAQSPAGETEHDPRKRVDTAVPGIAAEADAIRLLVRDKFPDLVAKLSDALACLQQLTAAMGPETPLPVAVAERNPLDDAPDDPCDGTRPHADALNGLRAAVSTADGTARPGHAPNSRGTAGPTFPVARR